MKRALIVAGCGAKSAWAGGLLQYLITEKKYDWDMYFGTGNGAILIALTALHDMDKLKYSYMEMNYKTIFSINPFGGFFNRRKTDFNILNTITRTLQNKTSLGESGKLHKKIEKMFSYDDYDMVLQLGKKLYPCVINYTKGNEEYICNYNTPYSEFMLYTLAASSLPLAMNLIAVNNNLYLDGGIFPRLPIQKAIDENADEIDIIVLRAERSNLTPWIPHNMTDVVLRTIEILDTKLSDYIIAMISNDFITTKKPVKVRSRFTPYNLVDSTFDSFKYNSIQSEKWWDDGFNYGKLDNQSKHIIIQPTLIV